MTAPTTMIGLAAGGLAHSAHTEAPDLAEVVELIDLQLVPPASVEVVLPRAHAQVLAVLLDDLLGREGGRR